MATENGEWSYADTDEEVLTRIAWYYYNDGLTQNEIGEKLNMSRIKVSRMLESGRRSGIIHVRINSRYQGCLMLERQIKERYGLLEAYVVPRLSDQDPTGRLGQAAAQFLMQRLQTNDLLAVGWGATVSNAIQRLGYLANERNIGLVSLTGGVGTYVDGMRSANWGSGVHLVPAPLVVRDPDVARNLSSEPAVANLLDMAINATYQLVGIGELSASSTVVRSGYVSPDEVEPLRRKGAVGDILCQFYDERGNVLDLPLHDRVIGVKLATLSRAEKVVATAGGLQKVQAIHAALRGKFVGILITDETTAAELIQIKD
ncbi:MAG: sugar-binding transcriptional regulator [Alphaproteobacteria bacterium]|nr:sugar-binding transcriptional regulator [Alphaproteobacteria bacterium]MBU1551519.1 sugar-binding transcriptional regulator [Alphaproteobacteria bacterium]MBU2337254.1 sugar-binding transcriptional regulator [Alphaproteobacteria bacterium]MBU2387997.1 sugar-binding transcriptional regulator [Alphaproteobacteria bacterium]